MPMKKVSTSCITDSKGKDKRAEGINPSERTLDFLRQFARTYHAEPTLDVRLCGFILN